MIDDDYPMWICNACGLHLGRKQPNICTWHMDTCDVCFMYTMVTEPRDFGHLKSNWKELANDI